jgi:hypothetical protein
MQRFEIRPLLETDIPRAAEYVTRWSAPQMGAAPQKRGRSSTENRIRWLIHENPLVGDGPLGYYVQDGVGTMMGLVLCFPNAFIGEDRRFVGLCSGSFFVEPAARMSGFILFRKYLANASRDFFFSTTCNTQSGALWSKLGAASVPNSEFEYILPINSGVMLPAFVEGRGLASSVLKVAEMTGRALRPFLKPLQRMRSALPTERCRDWDKLSDLSYRHRAPKYLTAERSVQFLRWRYGAGSPDRSAEVCVFRDGRGNEGWFSLVSTTRGRHGQIRGVLLLDAVWPRERIEFQQIFAAILDCPRVRSADALFLHPRLGVDYTRCGRLLFRRRLEGPTCYVRAGQKEVPASALDLAASDGDSGF